MNQTVKEIGKKLVALIPSKPTAIAPARLSLRQKRLMGILRQIRLQAGVLIKAVAARVLIAAIIFFVISKAIIAKTMQTISAIGANLSLASSAGSLL